MRKSTRRQILQGAGATMVSLLAPRVAFARAATDHRLVLIVLRGALDGLALAPAYGEPRYASLRGALALPPPGGEDGTLKLDGLFALHPSMQNTHEMYRRGEALLVHAVASPYRERSHFDGQDVLENGLVRPDDGRGGWLNRALAGLDGQAAMALGHTTPLVLRGARPTTSWAPSRMPELSDDTIARLESLYAHDAFLRERLDQALMARAIAGDDAREGGRRRGRDGFAETMTTTARFLRADDGPRIAVAELDGWDTHAGQGAATGQLARRLAGLDRGLGALRAGLSDDWQRTVVLVVTEFGRTVRINGSGGTDHGTGGAALALGGAVRGGRVLADWPGLGKRDLYEDRDLYPTSDLRSLFKAVLMEHLGLAEGFLSGDVFPDSRTAPPLKGLVRDA